MAINIILIVMATTALVYGFDFVQREKRRGRLRRCIMLSGLSVFIWNFGYGMMGLCEDYSVCYLWRALALYGVNSFLVVEYAFVQNITNALKNHYRRLLYFFSVMGGINFILVSRPSVVTFFPYNGRTAYSSNPDIARIYQGMFLIVIVTVLVFMASHWWRQAIFRREKEIVILMFCAHFSLVFAIIPDTVLPTFGSVSIPTSGMGAFFCYILTVYAADRMNAFELSVNSMSDFIFRNVDNSVLFFDVYGRLIMSNKFALRFFDISENAHPQFSELFEVSEQETKNLFNSESGSEGVKLTTRKSGTVCSVIISTLRDKYQAPTYTACFVYDLSKEERMFNEVNELKEQLQRDLARKTRQMERLTLQSITTIANTIDAKDDYTKGHSERVAEYSVKIAQAMGWQDDELHQLRNIALLHDIGKIGVSDAILKKPDSLTREEYEELKKHTTIGAEILKDITMIPDLGAGALYHHERFDGNGYPCGLRGKDIPIIARIITVADSFDAMDSKRVYREPLSRERILSELRNNRGTQFDPDILDIFLELYRKGALQNGR